MERYLCSLSMPSWLAQGKFISRKTMPVIIFSIFYLSLPLRCTVSVERGA
jgi:hypothetical protein